MLTHLVPGPVAAAVKGDVLRGFTGANVKFYFFSTEGEKRDVRVVLVRVVVYMRREVKPPNETF